MRDRLISSQYHVPQLVVLLLCVEEVFRLRSQPEYFGIMALGKTAALIAPYLGGAELAIGLTIAMGRLEPTGGPAMALVLGSGIQSSLIIRAYRRTEASRNLVIAETVGHGF